MKPVMDGRSIVSSDKPVLMLKASANEGITNKFIYEAVVRIGYEKRSLQFNCNLMQIFASKRSSVLSLFHTCLHSR